MAIVAVTLVAVGAGYAVVSRDRTPEPAKTDVVPVTAVVAGGATRQESGRRGLAAVSDDDGLVVCHDAARPFASPALYDAVAHAVSGEYRGAVPGVASRDTVKRVESGRVAETMSRDGIVLVQTPQAFAADALRDAHDRAAVDEWEATDDAMLLERAGYAVAVVPGEEMNQGHHRGGPAPPPRRWWPRAALTDTLSPSR
jgi:2-C-methyl-D-erythritol 4-phosphate cytidylyltransferase